LTNDIQSSSQNPQNPSQNPQNPSQNPQIPSQNSSHVKNNINTDVIYSCNYCDNLFNRSDNLKRHIEKFCKNKKHLDNVDVIKSKFDNTVIMSNDKYEILENYKHFIKENNLIKNTIPSTINNNNNTNNTNNGLINNGSINSGNIINIVQFGKEDISKCDLIEMMNIYLKSTGGNIFANILKYLNFNPNYPENFNILMSDLARENVKIHNGKKFVTKKFKTVKNDILNVLSSHITSMCDNYIEDPKIKKNDDILSKMKINDISVKLINDDDITPLLKDKKDVECDDYIDSDDELDIDDLTTEQERKLTHYENKRQGLQDITIIKLKDELYNNRDLIVNHHNIDVK